MCFALRPYQAEARDAILQEWAEGRKRTLLVLPTGCGKTIVLAGVAEKMVSRGGRVLIMAHRGELLQQAADQVRRVTGIECACEKGETTALGSPRMVTVGSVQSMGQEKRLERYPADYFDAVIVDEAHHCLSPSYQRVLDHFGGAKVLGVTATPDRGDRRNLGQFFDSMAYEYTMQDAIREKYLCPVRAQMIPLRLDLRGVRVNSGDYCPGDIGDVLEPYLHGIAREIAQHFSDRKTVIFLPLIRTSQALCGMLREMGMAAAEVNGESRERAEILRDFEAGRTRVLCNSMLLTEGWDCPSVDCIAVLRPTKIRSLYQQMVGRGMRLSPGKKELLLLDFLWMTERHSLCRPSALISRDEKMAERIDRAVERSAGGIDIMAAQAVAERDMVQEREKKLARRLEAMRGRKRRQVDPIQYAASIAAEDLMDWAPTFAWELEKPSFAQLNCLLKNGFDIEEIRYAGMANLLIQRLIERQRMGLATPRQIRCLERFGFRKVGMWKFEDAQGMISRVAENRWRVPDGIDAEAFLPG